MKVQNTNICEKETVIWQLRWITKVSNFDVKVFVEKKVLWLEVSVNDHVTMTVIYAGDDLLEKPTSFWLFQLSTETHAEFELKRFLSRIRIYCSQACNTFDAAKIIIIQLQIIF